MEITRPVPVGLPNTPRFRDLTDEKKHNLIVLYYIGKRPYSGRNKHFWWCKCKCGNELEVLGESFINGLTKSCGCLKLSNTKDRTCNKCQQTFPNTTEFFPPRKDNQNSGVRAVCYECYKIIREEQKVY